MVSRMSEIIYMILGLFQSSSARAQGPITEHIVNVSSSVHE